MFLQHLDWLRTVVRARIGTDAATVDDLLGEISLEVLRLEDKWKHIPAPGPWFYRVAIRKVALFRRNQHREKQVMDRVRLDPLVHRHRGSETVEPFQRLLWNEDLVAVRNALSKLNGKDVEILMLKYVHNFGYDEIRARLGIDTNKIIYRLRTARNRLRAALNAQDLSGEKQ